MVTEQQGDSNLRGRPATAKSHFLQFTRNTQIGRIKLLKMIIAKVVVNVRHLHLRQNEKREKGLRHASARFGHCDKCSFLLVKTLLSLAKQICIVWSYNKYAADLSHSTKVCMYKGKLQYRYKSFRPFQKTRMKSNINKKLQWCPMHRKHWVEWCT